MLANGNNRVNSQNNGRLAQRYNFWPWWGMTENAGRLNADMRSVAYKELYN